MSVVQPIVERKARRLPQVRLAAKTVRQHIDLKTFFTWLIHFEIFEDVRLKSVQDNEVAMPETARALENRAPNENPHAGWN